MPSLFIICYSVHICVCICIYISKQNLLHTYNNTCMLVFKADRLSLDNQQMCSYPASNFTQFPAVFFVEGWGLVAFLHLFGHGPWCPCSAHIWLAMLLRHYVYSFWCFVDSEVPGPLLPFLQYSWLLDVGVFYISILWNWAPKVFISFGGT